MLCSASPSKAKSKAVQRLRPTRSKFENAPEPGKVLRRPKDMQPQHHPSKTQYPSSCQHGTYISQFLDAVSSCCSRLFDNSGASTRSSRGQNSLEYIKKLPRAFGRLTEEVDLFLVARMSPSGDGTEGWAPAAAVQPSFQHLAAFAEGNNSQSVPTRP